jgi:hypothetical protein
MKKNDLFFKFFCLTLIILITFIFLPKLVLGSDVGGPEGEPSGQVGGPDETAIPGPLSSLENIQEDVGGTLMPAGNIVLMIINILNYILTFLGVVFLLLIIYGGFTWMTAAGNEEKVKKGKSILQTAVVGLVIIVLARVIALFVIQRIQGA